MSYPVRFVGGPEHGNARQFQKEPRHVEMEIRLPGSRAGDMEGTAIRSRANYTVIGEAAYFTGLGWQHTEPRRFATKFRLDMRLTPGMLAQSVADSFTELARLADGEGYVLDLQSLREVWAKEPDPDQPYVRECTYEAYGARCWK